MRRTVFCALALMLALVLLVSCAAPAPQAQPASSAPAPSSSLSQPEASPAVQGEEIIVLYTNDVHCGNYDAQEYLIVDSYRRAYESLGHEVILVDAGDFSQGGPIGSVSGGEYLIQMMNRPGYDVAAVGNHEFDYGMEQFFKLRELADFPFVSCNFTDLRQSSDPSYPLEPYVLLERGGRKIAFVGVTTPSTLSASTPVYFQDGEGSYIYSFCQDDSGQALYARIQETVDEARGAGADTVILLAHLGVSAGDSPWTSSDVIVNTTGIDAVIDGHSHSVLEGEQVKNKDGKTVLHTQTGTKLENIGVLRIAADGKLSSKLEETSILPYLSDLQGAYSEQMNQVVAVSEVALCINDPETGVRLVRNNGTNAADFCADAYRAVGDADIGLVNGGGIRAEISAGDVTYFDIINLHPYGNQMSVVEATGQEILDALEIGARLAPEENGGFLHPSGLTYEIDLNVESTVETDVNGVVTSMGGNRRVKNVLVGTEPLDADRTYTLASHDYMLFEQGEGHSFFADNTVLKRDFMVDSQLLITYVAEHLDGVIDEQYADPFGDGRIIIIPMG